MITVYLENTHDISSHSPYFHFTGIHITDLCHEVLSRLGIPSSAKVRMDIYDKRIGGFHRQQLRPARIFNARGPTQLAHQLGRLHRLQAKPADGLVALA